MFWCLPRHTKCEWATLKDFVQHLNSTANSPYHLAQCVDVSDSTQAQPEILLEDKGGIRMAIERKSVAWPPDYLQYHRTKDDFAHSMTTRLAEHFQDDVYVLEVDAAGLPVNARQRQTMEHQIANQVVAAQARVREVGRIGSSIPLPWSFWRHPEHLLDDDVPRNGVGVILNEAPEDFSKLKIDETRKGMAEAVANTLHNAARKFDKYTDHLKVVILEFYGDSLLSDDEIDGIIATAPLPSAIDQVWRAEPEWTSDSEWRVIYRHIR